MEQEGQKISVAENKKVTFEFAEKENKEKSLLCKMQIRGFLTRVTISNFLHNNDNLYNDRVYCSIIATDILGYYQVCGVVHGEMFYPTLLHTSPYL